MKTLCKTHSRRRIGRSKVKQAIAERPRKASRIRRPGRRSTSRRVGTPLKKQWKKSSRWRKAYKKATPGSRRRWLLYRLGQGGTVFTKYDDTAPYFFMVSARQAQEILGRFPAVTYLPPDLGFLQRIWDKLKKGWDNFTYGESEISFKYPCDWVWRPQPPFWRRWYVAAWCWVTGTVNSPFFRKLFP